MSLTTGEKRLVLDAGGQQLVMEAAESMTSSQFLSGVQELHGKEISFQPACARQGQEQSQFSDSCRNRSLFTPSLYSSMSNTHYTSTSDSQNTNNDYLRSFSDGSTSLPRTGQNIGMLF